MIFSHSSLSYRSAPGERPTRLGTYTTGTEVTFPAGLEAESLVIAARTDPAIVSEIRVSFWPTSLALFWGSNV